LPSAAWFSTGQLSLRLDEGLGAGQIDIVDTIDTNDRDNCNQRQFLALPCKEWTATGQAFLAQCQKDLWTDVGTKALAWLRRRGLNDDTIREAELGYNATDAYTDRQCWGLPLTLDNKGRVKRLWLPRGVVIPRIIEDSLWGLRIRRPKNDPKYYWVPGGEANSLYNADALRAGHPAMLLEGEIDARTVQQQAGDLITPVATGGTSTARRVKWIARLSLASTVLVAYDSDEAGEAASRYWLDVLPNARRWRPYWGDTNEMAQAGINLRPWVKAGLPIEHDSQETDPHTETSGDEQCTG
jgi:DNA primase